MTLTQRYLQLGRFLPRFTVTFALALTIAFGGASPLAAQSNYGAIRGTVSDSQGAALDKAEIRTQPNSLAQLSLTVRASISSARSIPAPIPSPSNCLRSGVQCRVEHAARRSANFAVISVRLKLHVGHGKHSLGGANRWVDIAVGGWRFNDITILQNGGPLALTLSNNNSSFGNSTQRPTIVSGINPCYSGSPDSRLGGTGNTPYFNPAAFTATGVYQYGNQPRASNCYGPGYVNSDLSLNKDFTVREGVHVEFRAKALNAFNTPQFNEPNLAVDAGASAGKITGTLGFPRLIQLGGRLTF